jgi:type VI protein secretion system component VasF
MGGLSVTSDQLRQLIEMPPGSMPGDTVLRAALQHSLNLTFWAMLAITVVVVAIAFLVPAVELRQASPATATLE